MWGDDCKDALRELPGLDMAKSRGDGVAASCHAAEGRWSDCDCDAGGPGEARVAGWALAGAREGGEGETRGARVASGVVARERGEGAVDGWGSGEMGGAETGPAE